MRNAALLTALALALSAPLFAQSGAQANMPSGAQPNSQPGAQSAAQRVAQEAALRETLQQRMQNIITQQMLTMQAAKASCPAGFSVQRRAAGAVLWTSTANPFRPTQGVDIALARQSNPIVKAAVIVHGASSEARVLPAVGKPTSDLTETFTLNFADASSPQLERMLWTRSMAVITSVELTEAYFADGTSWREARPGACTRIPNGFVLVRGN